VTAWDDYVLVGHIARPHGHRGQVIVTPRTDFAAERFAPGATIWVLREGVPTSLVIKDARFHKERPVLTLDGVVSGHVLHAKCDLSDVYEKPLLLTRGFHWVNELPVNR